MEIPADRLRRCGATADEISALRGEYAESVPGAVESLVARLERVADQDIRGWLGDLRRAGHFGEPHPEHAPPPDGAGGPNPESVEHTVEGDGVEKTPIELPADGKTREVDLETGTVREVDEPIPAGPLKAKRSRSKAKAE